MKKSVLLFALMILLPAGVLLRYAGYQDGKIALKDYITWKIEQKKAGVKKAKAGYPDKAMEWYIEQRAYPGTTIPENWREDALKHIKANNTSASFEDIQAEFTWTQLGPGNIGGRVRSIVVNPNNSSVIYAASVSGGVWKTTNGGSSWFPCKDDMENLAVCSMVMDPSNPNIIYAGTGEGFFNLDAIRGAGIFKTTDGGSSWTQLSATMNSSYYYVNDLSFDATTNTLWAATRKGLHKSTDGGASFTAVVTGSNNSDVHCTDIEIAPTSPTTIYASFGLFNQSNIQRSTNAGSSFSQVYTQSGMGRAEIAVSKSNPSIAYASFLELSTSQCGLMIRTTNGGSSWSTITIPGPAYSGAATYTSGQAWYNNILAVDPDNAGTLYAAGLDFWKSTSNGSNWTQKTNWYEESGAPPYIHADHHAIVFDPNNSSIIYVGTDGGVYKSTNKGETWNGLNNGLFITQIYYGAVDPSASKYYAGTQDNGTLKSTGSTTWAEIFGGDGGATEVDFANPNNIYIEYVNWAFFKSTNGGSTFFKAMNGVPTGSGTYSGTTDRTLFITPFSMDPNNSNILVAGTYRVWRTTNNAGNWSSISSDLTGDGSGSNGAEISTVVVAKGNSDVIYAGTSNGRVQVTTNTGSSWSLRNSGLPNLYVTRIATLASDPATAFVTFSGFTSGQKVYKTTNYGTSWSNVSGNLPNIPVNCVLVNPADASDLVVGTDLGIFRSANGGTSWTKQNNGMANVAVFDLDYRASDNKIFASTHGRGMFSASFSTSGGGGGGGGQVINLLYDDGTPSSGYFWGSAGQASANRITATVANSKVTKISMYILGVSSATTARYKPLLMSGGTSGPVSSLASLSFRTAVGYPGWDDIDVSSLNVIVNDEFYVGMEYDGTNKPLFGYDQINNGRAWDKGASVWESWNETYFMRATIETPATDVQIETTVPGDFSLEQNYPNPFNPSTMIRFGLPKEEFVTLKVYDINGREVVTLAENTLAPGTYSIMWNGKNNAGVQSASGTYIYRLAAGNYVRTMKMVLQK